MTKEITKSIILQELQDKFGLRELIPERFAFSEVVLPTYDIGQHLLKPAIVDAVQSITSAANFVFFTVPAGEKWHLHGYNVIFMTGAFTIAGVMIRRPTVMDWFYIDMAPAISVSYANDLPKDIVLFPGEVIVINVDGYTSTGNLELRLDVTKEEIR